jgi:hypothetical protein
MGLMTTLIFFDSFWLQCNQFVFGGNLLALNESGWIPQKSRMNQDEYQRIGTVGGVHLELHTGQFMESSTHRFPCLLFFYSFRSSYAAAVGRPAAVQDVPKSPLIVQP